MARRSRRAGELGVTDLLLRLIYCSSSSLPGERERYGEGEEEKVVVAAWDGDGEWIKCRLQWRRREAAAR
jgi:hypothetical protein